jgi:predicted small lipoprotein YifL
MIKKITLIILLFCAVISCGKKGDPEYMDPEKKAELKEILINSA